MKISFEMNTSKELGRHSVAKTIVFGESSFLWYFLHKMIRLLFWTFINNHIFFQISETNLWSYYFSRELGILMYILQVHFVENRFCSWRTGLFMSYASRKPVCAWDRVNTWRSTSYSEGGDRNHSHRG